jgi:hypothetical protein
MAPHISRGNAGCSKVRAIDLPACHVMTARDTRHLRAVHHALRSDPGPIFLVPQAPTTPLNHIDLS